MKLNWKAGLAIALVTGVGVVGCGDDASTTNNNTSANNTTNNTAGTTNNTAGTTNNTAGTTNNNTSANNTTGTTNNTTGTTNNNTTPVVETLPQCGDADEPARCAEDPASVTWAPSSVISALVVSDDTSCCFDFNGDGENDNALGQALGAVGDVNGTIAESIADGSIAIVLEHDTLADLAAGDFTVNFWLGVWDGDVTLDAAGGNMLMIDPTSIDAGAQPQAYLPSAKLDAGVVTAGPGSIQLALTVFDAPISLTISNAKIEADVDAANSALDTGVALTSGKLGGVVSVAGIFGAVNDVASGCDCLGLNGAELIIQDSATGFWSCSEFDTATCTEGVDDTCLTLADNCGLVSSTLGFLADIDTDGDGEPESVSIGATFEAVGAQITGVAAAQ